MIELFDAVKKGRVVLEVGREAVVDEVPRSFRLHEEWTARFFPMARQGSGFVGGFTQWVVTDQISGEKSAALVMPN